MMKLARATALLLLVSSSEAFSPVYRTTKKGNVRTFPRWTIVLASSSTTSIEEERTAQKEALLGLLGKPKSSSLSDQGYQDPVLADPDTKEPVLVDVSTPPGPVLGGINNKKSAKIKLRSPTNEYEGTSDTFINLLESTTTQQVESVEEETGANRLTDTLNSLRVFIPPPLRSALSATPFGDEYIPMRDLFTSPAVSFAYERGWRQGFARAGFPGPDVEFQMARDYFAPVVAMSNYSTIVDMSCATGLFTRRFAESNEYDRVLGCDYSESMLTEARRRIRTDPGLVTKSKTRLDLIRCDVGRIPMQSNSIEALHAGAAMHCWPDLSAATKEVYGVLKSGGRYFATTFLSSWFAVLQAGDGASAVAPSQSTFQYFGSVDQLRTLMEEAGFESEKIQIELLGAACVVIRCEK